MRSPILKSLSLALSPYKELNFCSKKDIVQSAVSIVFAPCKEDQLQLLFIQRAIHLGDINSGDVAFPGGKCQSSQNSLQAAIRQSKEQVGIELTQSQLLGTIPENFYARELKKGHMFVAAHVFYLPRMPQKIKTCPRQVKDFKWVELNHLIDSTRHTHHIVDHPTSLLHPHLTAQDLQNFKCSRFPGLDLGMGKALWGLTLNIFQRLIAMSGEMEQPSKVLMRHLYSFSIDFKQKRDRNEQILQQVVEKYKNLRIIRFSNTKL